MASFVNQGLLWGLLILAAPILIHLINLMRHRRVRWAAMEFLLVSKRKNSTWVRLKEFLLLLLRLAIVAGVVLILAQPLLENQWKAWFGESKTHQIVLLDDSFSMSDRFGNTSVFTEAKRFISRLGAHAAGEPTPQVFSLLRTSRAVAGRVQGPPFDLSQERVDTQFGETVEAALRPLDPTQERVALGPSLALVEKLLQENAGENVVLYIVSDFRARDWQEPGPVADALARLNATGAELNLINCVDSARPNLAISALEPHAGTRAAGVPVSIDVTVHNYSSAAAENISVLLAEDGRERPAVAIDSIGPGQSETRRFEVFFSTAGTHQVAARLDGDAVAADNARYCLIELPIAVPILIIDGDDAARNARFLNTVFQPGGSARTGLQPQTERPDFLTKHSLEKFKVIYLTDVDRLDSAAVNALAAYVQHGGGLVWFLGHEVQPDFYNDLYNGEGLFPVPLLRETQLLVDRLEKGADIEPDDQGIWQIFAGERNSYLSGVAVERYFSAAKGWQPAADSHTKILARLRNGEPLAVEKQFGEGRVVAVLTTAAPIWNNWGANPSFVVAMLELQSYLASPALAADDRLVGVPLTLELAATQYQPRVRFVVPNAADAPVTVDAVSTAGGLSAALTDPPMAGVYEVQLTNTENQTETRQFAINVDAAEGDLATVNREQIAECLPNIPFTYRAAADFQVASRELAGSNLSDWLLYLLVGILVGEQLLAYSASYHPAKQGGAT